RLPNRFASLAPTGRIASLIPRTPIRAQCSLARRGAPRVARTRARARAVGGNRISHEFHRGMGRGRRSRIRTHFAHGASPSAMTPIAGLAGNRGRNLVRIADRAPGGAELSVVLTDDADAPVLDAAAER